MKESFSNLYTRLYNENITELEALRKKEKTKALAILIPILSMFVVVMLMPFLAFLLLPFPILNFWHIYSVLFNIFVVEI